MSEPRRWFVNMARELVAKTAQDGGNAVADAVARALDDLHETSYQQGVSDTAYRLQVEMGRACHALIRERESSAAVPGDGSDTDTEETIVAAIVESGYPAPHDDVRAHLRADIWDPGTPASWTTRPWARRRPEVAARVDRYIAAKRAAKKDRP
jgi:hypothetical protein